MCPNEQTNDDLAGKKWERRITFIQGLKKFEGSEPEKDVSNAIGVKAFGEKKERFKYFEGTFIQCCEQAKDFLDEYFQTIKNNYVEAKEEYYRYRRYERYANRIIGMLEDYNPRYDVFVEFLTDADLDSMKKCFLALSGKMRSDHAKQDLFQGVYDYYKNVIEWTNKYILNCENFIKGEYSGEGLDDLANETKKAFDKLLIEKKSKIKKNIKLLKKIMENAETILASYPLSKDQYQFNVAIRIKEQFQKIILSN